MDIWNGVAWGGDFAHRIQHEKFNIHSVFDSVVNLQNKKTEVLLSLVKKPEAMGPNAFLVPGNNVDFNKLKQNDTVEIFDEIIKIGKITINFAQIKLWSPADWCYEASNEVQKEVQDWLETVAPGILKTRSRLADEFIDSLLREKEEQFSLAIQKLLGHGEGLTPSGDDFVAGVLLAYALGARIKVTQSRFITRLPTLVKNVWDQTNTISQTMLWYAAQGQGAAYVVDVAGALYADCWQALNLASKLFRIGATSGRYLLAGVLLGCEIFKAREQR